MNLPILKWIKFYCIASSIFFTTLDGNIDIPQKFCGTDLSRTMSKYCLKYPTKQPMRKRRQITNECCDSRCSLEYLLSNYCLVINTAAVMEFLNDKQFPVLNSLRRESEKINSDVSKNDIISKTLLSMDRKSSTQVRNNNRRRGNKRKQRRNRKNTLRTLDKSSGNTDSLLHSDSLTSSYHPTSVQSTGTLGNRTQNNNCTCRKRRAKKHKNRKILQVAPPNVGKIEDSQNPFYIFKSMY